MYSDAFAERAPLELAQIIALLDQKNRELQGGMPITWYHRETPPADPRVALPEASWPVWERPNPAMRCMGEKNWFFGTLTFPDSHCGIALAGSEARIFIGGYCPFTLLLDGEEIFAETHVWHASGPIADPITTGIEPGRPYRLLLCLEPTEIPAGWTEFAVEVQSTAGMEMAVEIAAAALQLRIAEKLAGTDAERQLVAEAARRLDVPALEEYRWEAVCASIAAMEAALAPLSARAKAHTVHLIGHTHIDMDWMWTWPDTVHCVRRDAKAVTEMLRDYPALTFTHSQVPTYQILQQQDPEVFAAIQQYVAEGRWENAAGTWVEGDLNMADGESVARQMLYAAEWTREHLGTKARVLWEPDTFGHPGNMPQLAKLGEFDCYYHWRGNPGREHNWPARLWEGVDGTPVLAYSTCYGSRLQPDFVAGNILNYLEFELTNILHIWGLGDHGGGLPRFQLGVLERYRDKPLIPTFKFSTMAALTSATLTEQHKLRRNRGETYSLFEGCFTTHAAIKRYNRACETALLGAETLCAFAGLRRNERLREAWTPVLFNQFHDILCGAAVHTSYENAYARAEATLSEAAAVRDEALTHLLEVDTGGETLVLLNPLGFARSEPVYATLPEDVVALRDEAGVVIPVQRLEGQCVFLATDIPAFACKSYRIITQGGTALPACELDVAHVAVSEDEHYFTVETDEAIARLSKASGAIGSYYAKALQRELVAHGVPKPLSHVSNSRADLALNVFHVSEEAPNRMSAWLINDILREEHLLRGAEVSLLETGPVFARFRVRHAFRASHIEEDIVFYRQFARVDFTARIDWQERGSEETVVPQLKVAFGSSLRNPRALGEGPFCISERTPDGQEQPTQKWVDVSGEGFGVTVLNDSKYGGDVLGGRIRLTLLRSPFGPDPDPDSGQHMVRFAYAPHAPEPSQADLLRAGMAFNRPPLAARTAAPAVSTPRLHLDGAESVVCTALYQAEHSARLILRLFEASGCPATAAVTLGTRITAATEVNFLENPTGAPVTLMDGTATVAFHPYEVKTLLLECEGL